MKIGTMKANKIVGKEVASEKFGVEKLEDKSAMQTMNIGDYTIEFNFFKDGLENEPMDEIDIEHVSKLLDQGYRDGELNHGKDEIRGYWKKVFKD